MPRAQAVLLAVLVLTVPVATTSVHAWTAGANATVDPGPVAADATARPNLSTANASSQPASSTPNATASIVAAYPNPYASGDAGEFVVLDVPPGTNLSTLSLSDGTRSVRLPAGMASGRLVVTTSPNRTRNLTDRPVVALDSTFPLANGGEHVRLRRHGREVDAVAYRDAPEGAIATWPRPNRGPSWRPLGATDRPVVEGRNASVTTFVLPDAGGLVASRLARADDRLLLGGYTLTSRRIADALLDARHRGVEVAVLLDGAPVDGLSRREGRLLDDLVAAGIPVRLLVGDARRYDFHHAKYAVVDDRAVVITENFKPAGTGGHSSRGWGAIVRNSDVADGLAETFRADFDARAATPWERVRRGRTLESAPVANATFPSRFEPQTVTARRAELVVTPDNAESRLVDVLDNATESLRIVQMAIDDPNGPLARATLRAARRGVDVDVLLSSAWYVEDENRRLAETFRDRAQSEDLPLEVRLAEPDGRFEKIHAKAAIVDDRRVVLGSLNWNRESMRNNRETVLVLSGREVAAYYSQVFDADWTENSRGLPVGLLAGVAGCLVIAALLWRRVEFES